MTHAQLQDLPELPEARTREAVRQLFDDQLRVRERVRVQIECD
ncbi:hypothetical protein ACFW1A_04675 [Kitasatospora sp. NPDC058965]